jgi:hypothetical protein
MNPEPPRCELRQASILARSDDGTFFIDRSGAGHVVAGQVSIRAERGL